MPRMKHAQHGFHEAMPHEVESMKARGWELDDGSALRAKLSAAAQAPEASAGESAGSDLPSAPPATAAPVKRGPGRPKKVA